jgi:hypothetical protein
MRKQWCRLLKNSVLPPGWEKSNCLWLRYKGIEFRIAKPSGQTQLTLVGSKPAALGLRSESWQPSSQAKNENRYHYIGRTASHEITTAFGHASGASAFCRSVETGTAQLLNEESTGGIVTEQVEEAIRTTFGIERDLQNALRNNIEQLEAGLKIADDGKELSVNSGRIDITAEDRNGATVGIELKAGEADRDAIGQILAYMGDISDSKKVLRGILIAGDFSQRAIAAARMLPNVQLRKYSFSFNFEPPKGLS